MIKKLCLFSILFVFLSMYIYAITNNVNDKIYIGQCSKEVSESQNYFGSGLIINKAIDKYGNDNFEKKIIVDNITNKALLNELEKHYIQLYASFIKGIGYNITRGGHGFMGKHTAESKAKISKNHKSKQPDFVHPLWGISPPNKGIGKSIIFEGKEFKSRQSAADYFSIPRTTINRIIKSGLGLKEYNKKHCRNWDKMKKVLEVETGKIYPSSSEMGRQINLCQSYAAEIARGNKKYKGLTYKYI